MAMPNSGVLKWSAIQTEFGGTDPIKLSEYYGKSSLPSSGLIKASDFYGTASLIVYDGLTASATSSTTSPQTLTDNNIVSLLSGVSASQIVITRMTAEAYGYYYADGTNSQDWESNDHLFTPTFTNQWFVGEAPRYETSYRWNTSSYNYLTQGTNAQRQAFVKAGLPIEYYGRAGYTGAVGFAPTLSYLRWNLAFTVAT